MLSEKIQNKNNGIEIKAGTVVTERIDGAVKDTPAPFTWRREGAGKCDNALSNKIEEMSGQNLSKCYQCGLCAGGCPAGFAQDLLPHQILHLAQLGMWDRIKSSRTAWLCASCFTCTVNCPRGVDIAKLMESVRSITLRQNVNYVELSRIGAETLAEFPQIAMVSSFRKHTA